MSNPLKAPFPWFGGKSLVSDKVWSALGDVQNYVEPFFGSGAVYLNRPTPHKTATINDRDGYVSNFWRAVQADPERVAEFAGQPVFECDLHARHAWLVARKGELVERLEGDPDYYDAKTAGWWCWGLCCWIGGGWCSGNGPWQTVDGRLIKAGNAGMGANRKLPHLGNAAGKGVICKLPHLGNAGRGRLVGWLNLLAEKLALARVCCGDWSRVCGPATTFGLGLTGVFLDPPYSHSLRDAGLYAVEDDCAEAVLEWCKANGDNPKLRIVLAGYAGEHDALESMGWRVEAWKANGGYGLRSDGRGRDNARRERLWFSPHCLDARRHPAFEFAP